MQKKIVCFGGGNAVPNAILADLKKYPVEIITVASMLESGGSSGQLRLDFNVLPVGDVRRHLLALSEAPKWKKDFFSLRIGREVFDDKHRGHVFGNIFISGLEYILKDFEKAIEFAHKFLEVKGRVIPATIESGHIYAVLENGEMIFGEDEIDVPLKHDSSLRIKGIFLSRKVKAYLPALEAVKNADLITIGPGDLYSSLLPCFLPKGMKEALRKTKAKKVFICNAMTKLGETNNFSVLDFAKEVEKYIGSKLDHVIYNTKIPSKLRIDKYRKQYPYTFKSVMPDKNLDTNKFIGRDIMPDKGPLFYDSQKLVKILMEL